jgi:hypothetical protein
MHTSIFTLSALVLTRGAVAGIFSASLMRLIDLVGKIERRNG